MPQETVREIVALPDDAPNFDWRDWVSFVGSVLGTALVVSIVLGAVVLLLSAGGN